MNRRGSVLVLVVAVLTLMFIIGATLLVMSSHERESTQQSVHARDLRGVTEAMTQGVMRQLRHDVVGTDGGAYNRGS